jgi:hypothetical protein
MIRCRFGQSGKPFYTSVFQKGTESQAPCEALSEAAAAKSAEPRDDDAEVQPHSLLVGQPGDSP